MELKDKLKKRRLDLSLTLAEVAKAVGVSEATVSRWESGNISEMKSTRIIALAKALQVNPAFIMGWEDEAAQANNIFPMPNTKVIPLIGTIACGEPILAEENIESNIFIPEEIKADFALRCKGDSMIDARINDGDVVYIRQQPEVSNGQIAAVLIGDEATLKRVYISKGTVTLMACNPKYEPFVFSGSELEDIKILGKAVGFTSKI